MIPHTIITITNCLLIIAHDKMIRFFHIWLILNFTKRIHEWKIIKYSKIMKAFHPNTQLIQQIRFAIKQWISNPLKNDYLLRTISNKNHIPLQRIQICREDKHQENEIKESSKPDSKSSMTDSCINTLQSIFINIHTKKLFR